MTDDLKEPAPDLSRDQRVRRTWRKLGTRVAVWYVAVTLTAFGAAGLILVWQTQRSVERQGQWLAHQTLEVYRLGIKQSGVEGLRGVESKNSLVARHVTVRLTDKHGTELLSSSSDSKSAEVSAALRATPAKRLGDWHSATAQITEGRLEVVVHDDRASVIRREALFALLGIAGVGLLAAVLGAFVIARRALSPLAGLASSTERIVASGDLRERIPVANTGDDLEKLAHLFNRLLSRNESLVRISRESLDSVAHDLRTPLTRLRAHAELALREASPTGEPAPAEEALADVIEESDKVLSLLRTLMDVAEASAGVMRLQKHPMDFGSAAAEAVELYDLISSERGVHITTHIASNVLVSGDRQRLIQVCANLIDNAIKYSPSGTTVDITVRIVGDEAVLTVEDEGIGIPPEDRPRIWDRLFRGDRSRSQRGLGLGLSLVKGVVEMHGGTVRLLTDKTTGTTFEVRLPRSK